jgi:hypothetical protein
MGWTGRAVAQTLSRWFPYSGGPGSRPSRHVGFVVDKWTLGQIFSEYFDFPANHHFTNFSVIIITRGWHNRAVGGRSAEWTQLNCEDNQTKEDERDVM